MTTWPARPAHHIINMHELLLYLVVYTHASRYLTIIYNNIHYIGTQYIDVAELFASMCSTVFKADKMCGTVQHARIRGSEVYVKSKKHGQVWCPNTGEPLDGETKMRKMSARKTEPAQILTLGAGRRGTYIQLPRVRNSSRKCTNSRLTRKKTSLSLASYSTYGNPFSGQWRGVVVEVRTKSRRNKSAAGKILQEKEKKLINS